MPWVPVAVVVTDAVLFAGSRPGHWWSAGPYALLVAGAVLLGRRSAAAAFVAAVGLALLGGAGFTLLLWAAYRAGRAVTARSGAVVVGAVVGGLVGQVALRWGYGHIARTMMSAATLYLVFAVLPLLAGRYLEQHDRLVRHLRWSRDLMADRERLDERLRIARDMHDSLGHRLSLVSVQAAALEVADLPDEHRRAVRQLAGAARGALDELYDLVGTLRGTGSAGPSPDVGAVGALVDAHREAGVPVTLAVAGRPGRVGAPAGEAAYRVVEEGLTNAAKHAPGRPVTVTLAWEPDSVLVKLANPVADGPAGESGGFGLTGLDERVRAAGGMLRHDRAGGVFTVVALLPTVPSDLDPARPPATGRTVTLGGLIAAAIVVVVLLAMVTGVRT